MYTRENFSVPTGVLLGEHFVTDLLENVSDKSDPKLHEIYYVNAFTSAKLLSFDFSERIQ